MENKNVVWISSYPKSGNTWVRFQMLNLLQGKQTDTANLEKIIPDIHKSSHILNLQFTNNILIKTHFMLTNTMPLVNQTLAYVYIVRHPMDVMISNLNYSHLKNTNVFDKKEKRIFDNQYINNYIAAKGDPRWIEHGMGSWVDNVRSWLSAREIYPNAILRYEDMLTDPAKELAKINTLLNLKKSDEDINTAVENSSFKAMKVIENQEIHLKKSGFFYSEKNDMGKDKGNRFMNQGQKNVGKDILTQSQLDAFSNTFGSIIEQLGYEL